MQGEIIYRNVTLLATLELREALWMSIKTRTRRVEDTYSSEERHI